MKRRLRKLRNLDSFQERIGKGAANGRVFRFEFDGTGQLSLKMCRERKISPAGKTNPVGALLTKRIGRMHSKVFGFLKTRTFGRIRDFRLNVKNRRENIHEDF